MKPALSLAPLMVLLVASLSGCFGSESEPAEASPVTTTVTESPTPEPTGFTTPASTPTPTPNNTTSPSPTPPSNNTTSPSPSPTSPASNQSGLVVTIRNYTSHLNLSDSVKVEWRVDVFPNRTTTVSHTEVHWAAHSVPDPQTPEDYGNGSGAKSNASVPASFSTSFRLPRDGTYFLRAHAVHNGTQWWSREVEIRVNVTRIEISPGLQFASYRPSNVTIQLGEGVRWSNKDVVAHTATNDTNTPAAFDTGPIAPGKDSTVIYFNQLGTYRYHCSIHPSMKATIVVVP